MLWPGGCVQQDVGDGKNNELVQSCANFRGELGGEPERTVALTRHTASSKHRGLPSHHHCVCSMDLVHSALCNGVAVLDCSNGEPPLLCYNNFVLEYVDHGAAYYRRYFYQHGMFRCPPEAISGLYLVQIGSRKAAN